MNDTVVIQAAGRFDTDARIPVARLKQHLKDVHHIDARRLSRLSMLALTGGLLPSVRAAAEAHTAVYMASGFGSPSVFAAMLENVFQHQIAKPFDFLAHLHNAPLFHLAGVLGCCGPSLFQVVTPATASWSQPLLLAASEIASGLVDSVLVGWCHEHQPAQCNTQEGSLWLLLRRARPGDRVWPRLRIVQDGKPPLSAAKPVSGGHPFQELADCVAGLARPSVHTLHVGGGLALALQGAAGFVVDEVALSGCGSHAG